MLKQQNVQNLRASGFRFICAAASIRAANLATAVAAPRIHSQLWPDRLSLEEGISPDTRRLLEAMGHVTQPSPAMGAANSVEVLAPVGSGSLGVVDPRRGRTQAVGEMPSAPW